MKRAIVVLALMTLVTGCSSTRPTEPTKQPSAEPAVDCLGISQGALGALQSGIDKKQPGFSVGMSAALASTISDGWFVAAIFSGPGVEDGQAGVWYTVNDPTLDTDNAFVSVDAYAREFSIYLQPKDFSSALDGVEEVRDCL